MFGFKNKLNLSSVEFQAKLKNETNALLIDVRTEPEHLQTRIPGSKLIDISRNDFIDTVSDLDKSKSCYVYCHSGSRSYQAAKYLQNIGFTKVYNLAGGIASWDGPTESN